MATNTQPLASWEALGPIEKPQHWLRVVEQFCDFVEKAGNDSFSGNIEKPTSRKPF